MSSLKNIMIIDDDPAILDSISILLEFEGYQVSTLSNPSSLFAMEDGLPDLLLLDIWLSGTDGRDVCKFLKQQSSTNKIPIVLISASREIEKSAKKAGADDFISKPFEISELLEKVRLHIN
jgi:DNA-binding response OmpR family regulator